jgi:chemotaxis protein CheD
VRTLRVTTNEYRIGIAPGVLSTRGIGSCVAVALYNPPLRTGGLAHISVPEDNNHVPGENPNQSAKNAIASMAKTMEIMGCLHLFTVARIAGGADMFSFCQASLRDIGALNVEAVRRELKGQQILIVGEDVLGTENRNVVFDLADGVVRVTGSGRKAIIL